MKKILGNMMLWTSNTRYGAMLYRYIAHYLDKWVFKASGGKTTFVSWWTHTPVVMMTTIGRKSGIPRTTPLVPVPHPDEGDAFLLIASNFGHKQYPAWYYNLVASGKAQCSIEGITRTYQASEISPEIYETMWTHIVAFLPNYALYRQSIDGARHIPVLMMKPAEPS